MTNRPRALIAGITGQDGSYLAELLLSKAMKYMALKEDPVTLIQLELMIFMKIYNESVNLFLHYGDITDSQVI